MSNRDRIDRLIKAVSRDPSPVMFILQSDKRCCAVCLGFTQSLFLGLYHTIWQATIMATRTEKWHSAMGFTVYGNFLYHYWISKQPFHNNQPLTSLIMSHSVDTSHKMAKQESQMPIEEPGTKIAELWPETSAVLGHPGIEVTSLSVLSSVAAFYNPIYTIYLICFTVIWLHKSIWKETEERSFSFHMFRSHPI